MNTSPTYIQCDSWLQRHGHPSHLFAASEHRVLFGSARRQLPMARHAAQQRLGAFALKHRHSHSPELHPGRRRSVAHVKPSEIYPI